MSLFRSLVALSLLAPGAALSGAAADMAQELPRSTPEEQGISSAALLGFVQAAEQRIDALHSFVLVRHGHVVAEGWWSPYAGGEPHELYSLSKSFTSTAVGLAVSDGKLSLDDPVLKFFPEEAPANPGKNLGAMRVRDLLRMCTGQRDEDLKGFPFRSKQDLARVFLEIPVPDKPGTHFVYNTAATYMLSAIVQKATGQTVLDFLGPRLFEPLGVASPTWEASAQGISLGGFGLSLRTEDIAKFGQLYLQKGQWRGKQIVPSAWVEAATSLQASNGSDPSSDWDQGYGYQFWRCRHGFYRGDGAFGQFCVVMPQYDAVIAMTGATKDLQSVLNVVWDLIVPALGGAPLPADPESDRRLAEKLSGLSLATQAGQPGSPVAARVAGRRYVFPANPQLVESVEFEAVAAGADVAIAARVDGRDQRIVFGRGTWVKGSIDMGTGGPVPVAANGAWTSDDTFTAVVCRYRTPYSSTYDMRFAGDELILETEANVGFDSAGRVRIVGKAQP
jgi:CubicO group peptidase (beta-lactamase class C family)